MIGSNARGFFITGTDTGVGKTLVSCALLQACGAAGLRTIGMKPVAAGREADGSYADVRALQAASSVQVTAADINPYRFVAPIAPHVAAADAGVRIDLETIATAYRKLAARAEVVIVEGAGGFCVPLTADEDLADLAVRLALPVILVVGMRLGCINHALLTARAIRACGLPLAGWIANPVDPEMSRADASLRAIAERVSAPLLACAPFMRPPDAAVLARQLTAWAANVSAPNEPR